MGLEADDLGAWRIGAGVTFEEVQLQLTLSLRQQRPQHHAKRGALSSSLATCLIVVRSAKEYSRLSRGLFDCRTRPHFSR